MSLSAVATSSPSLRVRSAGVGDVAFVCSTWKQSWWRESTWANRVQWPIFRAHYDKIVQRLLAKCEVLIACDPAHEDEILGYLVWERPGPHVAAALVWAYVKPSFRRAGVFTALLAASELPHDLAGVEIVHGTRAWFSTPPLTDRASGATLKPGRRGIEEKYPRSIHNPFRAFELEFVQARPDERPDDGATPEEH